MTRIFRSLIMFFIGALIFYLMFFMLAPFIAKLVPVSNYKPLIDFLVYVIVGWFGGVAIPVALFMFGIFNLMRA